MRDATARLAENAWYILGLRPGATRQDAEREAAKLLGMVELGVEAALHYSTPIGVFERTPERVRLAIAELRNPDTCVLHEIWATLEPVPPPEPQAEPGSPEPWPEALTAFGWGPPR